MIPVKLTIQGLYSYQEKQTIDFTQLTSANLFGIFGAVGSGKSSILEAITFAIYDNTDRLNLRDSRNYNMMNLKSNDLLIDFEFETGKNQTAYRSVVKGRRNSKKFDDVKTLERTAYRCEKGNWIPIEFSSLERAVGLSYENFKRTIIIPQGQFQEFLQLGSKDRTQMMKELFNLEKFELFYKVTSLELKNNAQKQMLEGQLKQLGESDPEQLNHLEARLKELQRELLELNRQIAENQKRDAEFKQLLELVRKGDESKQKMKLLSDKLPEMEELEKKISDFDYCLVHFKNLFDLSDSTAKKIHQLEEQLKLETTSREKSETQIRLTDEAFSKIKFEYDQRDVIKQKAGELEKMIRLNDLRQLAVQSEERIKKGEVFVLQATEAAEKLKQEKGQIELFLKEEKAKHPDMVKLSNAKSWHELHRNLVQQQTSVNAEADRFRNEIRKVDSSIHQLFKEVVFSDFSGEHNLEAGTKFLKEKTAQLKFRIAGFDAEIQHFNIQLKLEEYAVNLKDGEACPICGSLHHPEILVAANVLEAMKKTLALKTEAENEIVTCEQQSVRLSELQNQWMLYEQQMGGVSVRQKEIEIKLTDHQAKFQWEEFRKEEDVVQSFRVVEALKISVEKLDKELEAINKNLEQETSNREKYIQNLEKIRTDLIVAKTEIKTLTELIKLVEISDYTEKSKGEISGERDQLIQKYSGLENHYNELNNRLVELRKNKDTISGSITANQNQLLQEKKSGEELQVRIEKTLAESEYKTAEVVKFILNQDLNVAAEKVKISRFREEILVTQNQFNQLETEIGSRKYELEAHQQLVDRLVNDSELLSSKNKEFGVTEKSLADLKRAITALQDLRKTLEKLELRGENIKTMKSLFAASGFVNYISSVYLQNLCNAANDRFFQLTRQKLSLEITPDNNFQVRDYLNDGKVRSVKTLSGGQTFQAALSLALALADNIQKITESNQNFFFLDEGFGSLDKDSLSVVFEALKSLRKENRIVGVISHVEEMQQEIDVHLRITNEEERGSRIIASWQ